MRILLILLIFCSLFSAGAAPLDSARITITSIQLKDGTKMFGLLEKETADSLFINDFILGKAGIARKHIKGFESKKLKGTTLVETINGVSYIGEIIGFIGGHLILNTALLGIINIPSNTISGISSSESYTARGGNLWFPNPNATRYLFAPSAIPLKKREGYFQNAYLLANSVNVGITNSITVGGGVVIPLLFYVTPKISFKAARNLYLGAGVLFTQSFISEFGLSAGIGYGLVTYGSPEHNLTLGGGYGYAMFDKKYRTTPLPIVTLNGMTRIAKKVSLVTENWLIPRAGYNNEVQMQDSLGTIITQMVYEQKNFYSGAVSLGLRFMPGNRTSVDFSVVGIRANPGQNDLVIPYLDVVYKF